MQVIVFTGGGTAGHVFPGIAVIQALRSRLGAQAANVRFVWIGSEKGIERSLVEGLGFEYRAIASGKLRRYLSWQNFSDLFRIAAGYFQARKLLRQLRPVFVFSKGGFVSFPPVRAAHALKIPVYSHESDLDPGLATRLNLAASRLIFAAYAESVAFFPLAHQTKVRVSGNPVRSELFSGSADWVNQTWRVDPARPVLLVLGGSLGAFAVNQLIAALLPQLAGKVFVIHQTGNQWTPLPDTADYVSRPFFPTQMPALYARAHLIFGRAGAGTLWEAAAAGVPLILLPLAGGSRGDQLRNAQLFAQRGAARVLSETATAEDLLALISELLASASDRQAMQAALRGFDAAGAAQTIAQTLVAQHPEVGHV